MISHHHATFGGHQHSGSEDLTILVCQVVKVQTIKNFLLRNTR